MKIRVLILAFLLFVLLWAPSRAETPAKAVTVMVYLTGSDLESSSKAATNDVREMLRSGFDREQVNVVLFTGGTTRWRSGFPTDECAMYLLDNPSQPTEIGRFPLMNMGEKDTLTFFLRESRERFPADDYILILWDHGGGPLLGVCVDRLYDGDMLTLSELDGALRDSGIADKKKLRLIGFDACLMGSLEVAAVCAPYADYMVASSELEPASGWSYGFLSAIGADPDGAELGRRIIDDYFDGQSSAVRRGTPVTLSCVDLSRVEKLIGALKPFFGDLSGGLTETSYSRYSVIRSGSASVARSTGSEYDLIDLRDFLTQSSALEGADPSEAIAALDGTIVHSRSTEDGLHGLTVYFPLFNKEKYQEDWRGFYAHIAAPDEYANMVSLFGEILTGEPLADWRIAEIEQEEADPELFTCYLTPQQRDAFASARLTVLKYDPKTDSYSFVDGYDDVTLDRDGALSARILGEGLVAVSPDGQELTLPLVYSRSDRFIIVKVTLERYFETADGEDIITTANLRLRENPETGLWEIVDAYNTTDGMMTMELDLSEWDWINLLYLQRIPLRDGEGKLLPFGEWELSGAVSYSQIGIGEVAGFRFCPVSSFGSSFYAMFEITDTQGTTFASEMIPVRNLRSVSMPLGGMRFENDFVAVTADAVDIADAQVDGGVTVRYSIENRTDRLLRADVKRAAVNGVTSGRTLWQPNLDPNGTVNTTVDLSLDFLRAVGISEIGEICFDLCISDENYSPVADLHIVIPLEIDLSGMSEARERRPLARTVTPEGMTLELLDMRAGQDGSLECEVYIENHTGHEVEPDVYGRIKSAVNGCGFATPVSVIGIGGHRWNRIGDGMGWYGSVVFEAPEEGASDPLEQEDQFQAYGIGEIRSVTLCVFGTPATLELEEPFDYAAATGKSIPEAPEFPAAAETEEMILRVESVRLKEDEICLVIRCENLSDDLITLDSLSERRDGSVSGVPAAYIRYKGYVLPHGVVRMAATIKRTDNVPVLPFTDAELPVTMLVGERREALPAFRISADVPFSAAGVFTDGYRVLPGEPAEPAPAEPAEPTPVDPVVRVPDRADILPVTARTNLTDAQASEVESGLFVLARRDGDKIAVLAIQRLTPAGDGQLEARFPGLVLCCFDGEDTSSVFSSVIRDGDAYLFNTASLIFMSTEANTCGPEITVRYDPGTGEAAIALIESEDPLFERQSDYDSVYDVRLVRILDESGPLPHLGDMASAGTSYGFGYLYGKPLPLSLYPVSADDGLVWFFSLRNRDGTGFSTPPQAYPPVQ